MTTAHAENKKKNCPFNKYDRLRISVGLNFYSKWLKLTYKIGRGFKHILITMFQNFWLHAHACNA